MTATPQLFVATFWYRAAVLASFGLPNPAIGN